MSGGTLIALACDEIVMDPDAALGPLDPQIGDMIRGTFPAHSWIYAAERKGEKANDTTFIMRDISEKALRLMREFVHELLFERMEDEEIQKIIDKLLGAEAVHSLPISAFDAKNLNLPINTDMPDEIHEYMATFGAVKTGVDYLK
jgi:ClpP class serine protease